MTQLPPMAAQAAVTAAARSTDNNVAIIGIARWTSGTHANDENGKRSLTVLVQPGFDLARLEQSVAAARDKTFTTDPTKHRGLRMPVALATDKGTYPGYDEGVYLIRASTKRVVKIVDSAGKPVDAIDAEEQLYDGRWVELHVGPYGYNMNGNKGVALGLNGVQLLDDGERIGRGGGSSFGVYASAMPTAEPTPSRSTQSPWG